MMKFRYWKMWDIMTKNQISAKYRNIEIICISPKLQISSPDIARSATPQLIVKQTLTCCLDV